MAHPIRLRVLNSLDFIGNNQSKRSHRGQRGIEIFVSSCGFSRQYTGFYAECEAGWQGSGTVFS